MTEPIPTGCDSLDELLGGGLERGVVTQVYGPPAAGKTNLALTASVEITAAGDSALYLDTEDLSMERFRDIAAARTDDPVADVASRLIVSEANTFDEQEQAVRDAADVATRVELIILDSATGFYRLERTAESEEGDTLRRVGRQVTHLLSLARRHDIAVLITNQVFTDPDSDRVRPLGGHTLEHWTGVVLRLDRFRGGNRRATLEKHRSRAAGQTTTFQITDAGLEGNMGAETY